MLDDSAYVQHEQQHSLLEVDHALDDREDRPLDLQRGWPLTRLSFCCTPLYIYQVYQ